jgi:hypothetical protein
MNEVLEYTKNYQKSIKGSEKRHNDRYVTEASNRAKAMWQLINREIGKPQKDDYKLELKIGNNIISNPIEITEKIKYVFYEYCVRTGTTKY